MFANSIFCLVIHWCLKFLFQNISPVCQQVTFRNPCWTELWEFQARRSDCKAQQTLLMHNGLEVSLLMLQAANIIALSEKKDLFIYYKGSHDIIKVWTLFTLWRVLGLPVGVDLLHLLPMPPLFFCFFWALKLTAQVRGTFMLWHKGGIQVPGHSFMLDGRLLPKQRGPL